MRVIWPALLALAAAPAAPLPPTPSEIVAGAPAAAWAAADPADVLVIEPASGGRIVVLLAPTFAPAHVANIRRLARAGWYDGTAVTRVQENYVVQWGGAESGKAPPAGLPARPPAEYDRLAAGLGISRMPYPDAFAPIVGTVGAFPVAREADRAWLTHCYGMVGVGRDMAPDTGSGAELYAVIGHAPRALDRNIALVGRVVEGLEHWSALPRGDGALGFYADPARRAPIRRARLAMDMPAGERPRVEWLRPDSAEYQAWMHARANRRDAFFVRPAGGVDLCNALPPLRLRPSGGR